MATTKTAARIPGEPPMPVTDLDNHKRDLRERQEEINARRPEMLKCLNPNYARQREMEKDVFVWTIEVEWYAVHHAKGAINYHKKASVVAQNENDAWSEFCDKIGAWPSRRDAKITIKRGKQMSASQVAAEIVSVDDVDIPRVEFKSKDESPWVAL